MKLAAPFLLFICVACDLNQFPHDVPHCVEDKVRKDNSKEVWQYSYKNQAVYLIVPDCCDQFVQVYSSSCKYLCAPSGGIAGDGDGLCPQFLDEATGGVLLWKAD